MDRYATAAEVLRMLSAAEPVTLNGREDPLKTMFRLGAEACERLGDATRERAEALSFLAEIRALLIEIVDDLEARLSAQDDVSFSYTLARRALARSTMLVALGRPESAQLVARADDG